MHPIKQASRRNFIKNTGLLSGLTLFPAPAFFSARQQQRGESPSGEIQIGRVNSNFEREKLARPFGFKGGFMQEVWQVVAAMESKAGTFSMGLGTQNVLWSDAGVFEKHSENGGNALMFAMTEYALRQSVGRSFMTPVELLTDLLEEVYAYGKKISGNPNLRKTFALNALVAFDNAAWLLYAFENRLGNFDAMIPEKYRGALSYRHEKVVSVPAFSYATAVEEMQRLAEAGYFLMKIKLGHPGSQQQMLQKDCEKLSEIHRLLGKRETPHTANGKIAYYLDLNGRYASKDTLLRLLDHARSIGAFEQLLVVEEPFPEHYHASVGDVGVMVAADESAHTDVEAKERLEMGYGSIALKPVAKTLSMTLKIAQLAHKHQIPCFCADLTVNPVLVDWNKNMAARLPALQGFEGMGMMENNGHQNYQNWQSMLRYHPFSKAGWIQPQQGVFRLGQEFYTHSGGIFSLPEHYRQLVAFS